MSYNPEMRGLESLRKGLLFFIVVPLVAFIILLLSFSFFGSIGTKGAAIFIILLGMVIIVVLYILSYSKLKEGFSVLSSIGKDVGIGSTGLTLMLIGVIIMLIGAILTVVLIGIFIIPIGGLILFIGNILFGIGLYKVGSTYNNTLTQVGGILVIIPVGILQFIGAILSYIGIGDIIKKLPSSQPTISTTPQSSQVYPLGTGTLRGGVATVTLYASQPVSIYSAQILGTQYVSYSITPSYLNVGNNVVTINFGNVQLTAGVYTIRLTLSNGQYVDVQVSTT